MNDDNDNDDDGNDKTRFRNSLNNDYLFNILNKRCGFFLFFFIKYCPEKKAKMSADLIHGPDLS